MGYRTTITGSIAADATLLGATALGYATVQHGNATLNPQRLVGNGVAFDSSGHLSIADTARSAIWRVDPDRRGNEVHEFSGLPLPVR